MKTLKVILEALLLNFAFAMWQDPVKHPVADNVVTYIIAMWAATAIVIINSKTIKP